MLRCLPRANQGLNLDDGPSVPCIATDAQGHRVGAKDHRKKTTINWGRLKHFGASSLFSLFDPRACALYAQARGFSVKPDASNQQSRHSTSASRCTSKIDDHGGGGDVCYEPRKAPNGISGNTVRYF